MKNQEKEILKISSLKPSRTKKKEKRDIPIFLLQPFPGSRKKKKRVGRGEGSGHGKTSGRGQKGQKARTGYSKKIGFEGGQMPLYKRIPKRGFHNPFKIEYQVVNLEKIDKIQTQGEITIETLYENGLIRKKNQPVKILGMGEISKPLTIKANAASKSAIQKVESKGGKIEIIQF